VNLSKLLTLPYLDLSRRRELPVIAAVYVAVLEDRGQSSVLYVGRTRNLNQRWATHNMLSLVQAEGQVAIYWSVCDPAELKDREHQWIKELAPKLNGGGPKTHTEYILVSMRVPVDLLARVDALARQEGRSRSNMFTRLVERALAVREAQAAQELQELEEDYESEAEEKMEERS
jgi:predicted transcriptional regulator/predicted GIY-YIG superfamily endonuclease